MAKAKSYPNIHRLHKNKYLGGWFMIIFGLALIITNILCSYTAIKSPYAWTKAENVAFFGLSRPTYALGCMMIFLAIVLGHFNIAKIALTNCYFMALGRLTFVSSLIYPLVIMYTYASTEEGLDLTVLAVIYYGMGNIVSIMIACFFIYLCFEFPFKRLIEWFLISKVNHDNILK